MTENLSLLLNVTPTAPGLGGVVAYRVADFCAASDSQAVIVAGVGVGLGVLLLVWFGRVRPALLENHRVVVLNIDKLLLTLNAFAFVIILGRLLRAA